MSDTYKHKERAIRRRKNKGVKTVVDDKLVPELNVILKEMSSPDGSFASRWGNKRKAKAAEKNIQRRRRRRKENRLEDNSQ